MFSLPVRDVSPCVRGIPGTTPGKLVVMFSVYVTLWTILQFGGQFSRFLRVVKSSLIKLMYQVAISINLLYVHCLKVFNNGKLMIYRDYSEVLFSAMSSK